MKICIIGGIYTKGGARKNYIAITPETNLESGLRTAGHDVTALSHYDETDFSRFDVVHVHHLSWGAARLACDPSSVPFVFTSHDASQMCNFKQPFSRKQAMRYVFSRADAVVALSDLEAAYQRDGYRLQGAIHATVPNGIDADLYAYRRTNSAGRGAPWQLLFVGQLTPQKRVDVILKAFALLPRGIELSLVYQTPALEPELRALAQSLGIEERVHFLGKRGPEQLAALYQSSDLLLLPSAWEALPSVISEAMLCGLPFVASTVGGIPEQANGFGLLLDRPNDADLAMATLRVLDNYSEYAATGEAMSRHARDRFAIPRMVERHLVLYERVVQRPIPRRHSLQNAPLNSAVRFALRHSNRATLPNPQPLTPNPQS
jgi:glycosyltransferase involved in cell wall biosynthesis